MSLIYDFLNASECLPAGEYLRHLLTNGERMTNVKTRLPGLFVCWFHMHNTFNPSCAPC